MKPPIAIGAVAALAAIVIAAVLVFRPSDDPPEVAAVPIPDAEDSSEAEDPNDAENSGDAVAADNTEAPSISGPSTSDAVAGPTTVAESTTATVEANEVDPDSEEGETTSTTQPDPSTTSSTSTSTSRTSTSGASGTATTAKTTTTSKTATTAKQTTTTAKQTTTQATTVETTNTTSPSNTDPNNTEPTVPPNTDGTCRLALTDFDGESGVVELGSSGACAAVGLTIQGVNPREELTDLRWGRDIQVCQRHPSAKEIGVTITGGGQSVELTDGFSRDPFSPDLLNTIAIRFEDQESPTSSPRPIAICRTAIAEMVIVHQPVG